MFPGFLVPLPRTTTSSGIRKPCSNMFTCIQGSMCRSARSLDMPVFYALFERSEGCLTCSPSAVQGTFPCYLVALFPCFPVSLVPCPHWETFGSKEHVSCPVHAQTPFSGFHVTVFPCLLVSMVPSSHAALTCPPSNSQVNQLPCFLVPCFPWFHVSMFPSSLASQLSDARPSPCCWQGGRHYTGLPVPMVAC